MSDDGPRTVRAGRRSVEIHRPERLRADRGRPRTVRALPGALVAVPVSWDQLDDPDLHARRRTVADAVEQARSSPCAGLVRRGAPRARRAAGWRGCGAERSGPPRRSGRGQAAAIG